LKGVAVYMEGGGNSADDKSLLRQGMSTFLSSLREAARRKRLAWKVVPCGSRNHARDAFLNANKTSPEAFNVLLVDSEVPVARLSSPRTHLKQHDGWDLTEIVDDAIHLMIQIMETWIIADTDAVATYYSQHFLKTALPRDQDLERVGKEQIYGSLQHATLKTQKREYRKIRDAAALLGLIDPVIVRRRCPSCDRLFTAVTQWIDAG